MSVFETTSKLALFILTLCVVETNVLAGVYCCVKPEGKFEFQDTPCQGDTEQQTFLPLTYKKTDPTQVKKQETELKKVQRQSNQLQKKQNRLHQKKVKQLTLEKEKSERRAAHCLRVQEKIEFIESQLRRGCKLKKSVRLHSQLEQAERMKQRYCGAT